MTVWLVKRLRDLRSGKPETDVTVFATERLARTRIARDHGDFLPFDVEEAREECRQARVWYSGEDPNRPEEYVELEEASIVTHDP